MPLPAGRVDQEDRSHPARGVRGQCVGNRFQASGFAYRHPPSADALCSSTLTPKTSGPSCEISAINLAPPELFYALLRDRYLALLGLSLDHLSATAVSAPITSRRHSTS